MNEETYLILGNGFGYGRAFDNEDGGGQGFGYGGADYGIG